MNTIGMLVVIAGFLSAFLGIFTINLILMDLFQREREETLKRLNEELLAQQRQKARERTASSSKDPLSEIIADAGRGAEPRKGILQRIEELTLQSGVRVTTSKLLTICGAIGAPRGKTVAVIGGEEIHPVLAKWQWLARVLNLPYVPITPTFPWLGLLGLVPLPTKWRIIFGAPIDLAARHGAGAAEDDLLVNRLKEQIREHIQRMVIEGLRHRASVFA